MLSGPQRKFVEGIVSGLDQTAAYRAAYPKSTAAAARANAVRLIAKDSVAAEIARLRAEAGSGLVLTLADKRKFLRETVTSRDEATRDRLKAVELDAKLAGEFKPETTVQILGNLRVVIGDAV